MAGRASSRKRPAGGAGKSPAGEQPRRGRRAEERLSRGDWERAALTRIGEKGLAGLAIEPLARHLGVTKGSFYWHFESPEELLRASLARWERVFTDRKYAKLGDTAGPAHRLEALFADVASGDPALGVFHALSLERDHPLVGLVFRRVTRKRLRFLERTLAEVGVPEETAADRALLLYSTYIGFLQITEGLTRGAVASRRRRALTRQALALLVPEIAR